jgi:serine kinase of HPr protein (carbohydrate metabolism regulator)
MTTDGADIHATCVALGDIGVLLRGPSGSGKSDLALRLIDGGARLVADDRVCLARRDGRIVARSPAALRGLIEVRGLGIVRLGADRIMDTVPVGLVCDLVPGTEVERLPEPAQVEVLGLRLPRVALAPFETAAPAKLRLAAGAGPGSIMVGA